MKMIQRYTHSTRQSNAAAGVYTTSSSGTLTAKFNLIINRLEISAYAFDQVTNQAIDNVTRINLVFTGSVAKDQPGFIDSHGISPLAVSKSGTYSNLHLYKSIAAGEVITCGSVVYLYAVTGNIISVVNNWAVGYLCPEDYLSVEGFDVKA